jgi:ABC-type bacteriocin/lantibiotic exporter with double-glycine peptidase domain
LPGTGTAQDFGTVQPIETFNEAHTTPGDVHHGPSPLRRLVNLLRLESGDLWVIVTYAVGIGLLSLAVPIATASLVNSIAFGTVLQPVVVLTLMVFAILCFEGVMRAFQFQVVEVLQRRVFVRVALAVAQRLPRVETQAFERARVPEMVNRFFDVLTVQKTVAVLLLDGLAVMLQALIGTVLLAFYHPILLAFDVVLIVGIVVILFPMGVGAIDTSIAESKAKYAVAAWLEELARHHSTFHGFHGFNFAVAQADKLTQKYLFYRAAHFHVVFRQHVGSLAFKAIVSAALLGIGGWLVIQRGLTIGQLAAAELVVSAVVAGIAKFGKQLESFYDLVTAIDKIGHLTDLPLEREGGSLVPQGSAAGARVEFRAVSFAYGRRATPLRDINLVLSPGARVAIFGRGGEGKSALADLLIGRRVPTAGVVTLEGADLRELSLCSLRDTVALVRDVEVFEGSVADNVTVGRENVSGEDIRRTLAMLRLDTAVGDLSEGIHTLLSPDGAPLSHTQARVLMFARAIAWQPRLVVVDCALDVFDIETAREVMAALDAPDAPWTLLVLTQRESIASLCRESWELRRGSLVRRPTVSQTLEA